MKRIVIILALIFSVSFVMAQQNKIKVSSGTADTDSLSTTAFRVARVVGVAVTLPIAADTIIVSQGAGVIATILVPATASNPFYIPLDCAIDSSIVTVQRKKTSHVTTIFRLNY